MNRRDFLGLTVGASLSVGPPLLRPGRQAPSFHVPSNGFLRELPGLMETAAVPGVSLAVLTGGRAAFTQGEGTTGGEHPAPVGPDTMFEAASLSKPVFAYLVMLLVQDGAFDLDRPLDSYLGSPYLPDDPRTGSITARHVLSHTTGYRNWRFNPDQKLVTDFAPGERFQYSGEGYYELQRVVEAITGRGMAALARDRVLVPLGMSRSSYVWRSEFEPVAATGHRRDGQPVAQGPRRNMVELGRQAAVQSRPLEEWRYEEIVAGLKNLSPPGPTLPVMLSPNAAGSLITTANDYVKFVAAMMGALEGPLRESWRRQMMMRRIGLRTTLAWGLGWGLEEREQRTFIWHWGDNPGFKNFVMADPATRTGVMVFTNGDNGRAIYERVVRASAGFDPVALVWI